MPNFQRKNSNSNTQVGKDFESLVAKKLSKKFPNLTKNYIVKIGFKTKESHKFDFGSDNPKIIIECKSHMWTESYKVPSAKLTTWDQAMLYFFLAPQNFKKIFIVKRDFSAKRGKSLCEYYLETHNHLIPKGVEFRELDEGSGKLIVKYPKRLESYARKKI